LRINDETIGDINDVNIKLNIWQISLLWRSTLAIVQSTYPGLLHNINDPSLFKIELYWLVRIQLKN